VATGRSYADTHAARLSALATSHPRTFTPEDVAWLQEVLSFKSDSQSDTRKLAIHVPKQIAISVPSDSTPDRTIETLSAAVRALAYQLALQGAARKVDYQAGLLAGAIGGMSAALVWLIMGYLLASLWAG
jgi:hypothetical protein